MKNNSVKKFIPLAFIALVVFGLLFTTGNVAKAEISSNYNSQATLLQATNPATKPATNPDPSSCTILFSDPCTAIVNLVLTTANFAMGLLIAGAAWLVTIGVTLLGAVYNSQAVQSGFADCLLLVNLVFVLGIIVIAIATILHSDTYGYKKVLWRLIAMAIIVNFGLVITAPIMGFADGMTNYFLSSITKTTNQSGPQLAVSFSTTLANSSNAQTFQAVTPNGTTSNSNTGVSVGGVFMQMILALMFLMAFKGLIALTFLLLAALLFVRYIYLVILLALLPFAWVTWIFPNFSKYFSNWWAKFIHWTFFPTAAMFFIWLALSIQTGFLNSLGSNASPTTAIAQATGLGAAPGATTGTGLFAQMMNTIIVMFVMIGGLIAASKFAENAGEFAVTQAKAVTGAVTGYVGRRGGQTLKRVGTAPLRTQWAKNAATALQQPLKGTQGKWANRLTLGIPDWTARKLGQGMESGAIAGGSKLVGDSGERYKKMTADQRLNRLSGTEAGLGSPQSMALLKQILEDKNIDKLSEEEMERYFGKGTENAFKRFGQEKLYKELQEKSGLGLKYLEQEIAKLKVSDPENKLPKKEAELYKLVASQIEENPDGVAGSFANPKDLEEKRKKAAATGRVPMSLQEDHLNRMQRIITGAIANDKISASNVSVLMKSVFKKNEVETFSKAVDNHVTDEMRENMQKVEVDPKTNKKIENKILVWNDKQVGRGALDADLRDIYKLRPAPKTNNDPPRIIPSTDPDRPEKEPRSRTIV